MDLEVADQLEAGTVWVNDWHMVTLDEYTEEKFVHLDLSGRLPG